MVHYNTKFDEKLSPFHIKERKKIRHKENKQNTLPVTTSSSKHLSATRQTVLKYPQQSFLSVCSSTQPFALQSISAF